MTGPSGCSVCTIWLNIYSHASRSSSVVKSVVGDSVRGPSVSSVGLTEGNWVYAGDLVGGRGRVVQPRTDTRSRWARSRFIRARKSGKIENKSSSQGMYQVYWNSKSTREGGVQGCRRLAFRLVCDLSPLRACPGADTKRHAGGPAASKSRVRRPCPSALTLLGTLDAQTALQPAGGIGAPDPRAYELQVLSPATSSQGFLDRDRLPLL